jgi:hypothetical protein
MGDAASRQPIDERIEGTYKQVEAKATRQTQYYPSADS